ncbi:uncharacterized protein LOC143883443 [Tasmannia lanceolata]|uniref:uncharacterized protein LOC143883443 n=1 Tax=Tasmannia lanceolata TaxID=3420 RepID=UPI004063BEAC
MLLLPMSPHTVQTIHGSQPMSSIGNLWLESDQKIVISHPDDKEGTAEIDEASLFGSIRIGIEMDGDDYTSKCKWLRSHIIGLDAEFDSPFGSRRITYSDHTASGRFLRFVEECLERNVLPFYGNTHTVDSYVGLHTSKLVNEACKYIKRCMGAGSDDALLFCGTGSTACIKRLQEMMGVAVPSILRLRMLDCLLPFERWVVFVGPYEHHSNLLSWRQSLAEVVEIGVDEEGLLDMKFLVDALESPQYSTRPKLGSFSACSNVTGTYVDTRAIARVLREHGAYACFDFACSGPYEKVEMKTGEMDGYDAVFLSPHKFIGGPASPGILVMSPALYRLKGAPPSTSGGGTVRYVNGFNENETLYCEDLEEREDAGTPGIVQKIRAALAFRVKQYMGPALIHAQETFLIRRALERLLKISTVHLLGNTWADRQPIISFLVYPKIARGKHLHCRFVTKLLNDLFGIQARGGCMCAGPYGHMLLNIDRARSMAIRSAIEKGYEGLKPGWTRISFSYYTSVEEMEFVLDAIELIAMYGHRFLSLYNFDWRTGDWTFIDTTNNTNKATQLIISTLRSDTVNGDDQIRSCISDVDLGAKYAEYIGIARRIAETLPDFPEERPRPKYIDPQLVTFMI